jgi:hypothetical protein
VPYVVEARALVFVGAEAELARVGVVVLIGHVVNMRSLYCAASNNLPR